MLYLEEVIAGRVGGGTRFYFEFLIFCVSHDGRQGPYDTLNIITNTRALTFVAWEL